MSLLKIKECLPFSTYILDVLKSEKRENLVKTITLQIEFYGVEKPVKNSYLLLNEALLDKSSSIYT